MLHEMRLPEVNRETAAPSKVVPNIAANFLGGAWGGVMALGFTPLYIKFIGIQSYALIGIYASLRSLFAVLDMGLSTTLNRELARLSVMEGANQEARDLVRTFEVIYWGVGILIGAGLVAIGPLVARNWLHAGGVAMKTVEQAVMIMGLVLAFEWPVSLYFGGLMGLQRQVLLNGVKAGTATFRNGGAILVLWLISPTIQAYFIWQIIVTAAQTLLMAGCLWGSMPMGNGHPIFRKKLWFEKWRFATGVAGITLLATILTQLDKVVLSNVLTLEFFGYYALAVTVAATLNYISSALFSALFPRLTQAVAERKETKLIRLYHKSCQVMSLLIMPSWIIIALFSKDLLSFWIRNPLIVKNSYWLVSLITTGTAFNAIMILPFALQLAHGWTKLSFYKNVVSVVFFIPILVWLVRHYGAVGAAIAWIAINAGYFLMEIPLMHRRILKKEMWRWYSVDIGLPLLISLCTGICAAVLRSNHMSGYVEILYIAVVSLVALLLSGLAMPLTREWLQLAFRSIRPAHAAIR